MITRSQTFKKAKLVQAVAATGDACLLQIDILNDDCLRHIFSFVSALDILNMGSVSKRWQTLCQELWKSFRTFDVTSEQLEYNSSVEETGQDIRIPMCEVVFSKCWNYLTKINLTRVDHFQIRTLMDSHDHCDIVFPPLEKLPERKKINLGKLVECENIEELWLCNCIIEVDDDYLKQLFQKNRKLRFLTLNNYKLVGTCFAHLSIRTLESLLITNCFMEDPKDVNSIMRLAPNLHTLSVRCLQDSPYNRLRILSPHLMRLNVDDSWKLDFIPDICELKNLTVLSLANTWLNDGSLEMVLQSCMKLIALDITFNEDLTDASLHNLNSLLHLKYLSIGCNDQLTDAGLLALMQNLQTLDVCGTLFSERALLTVIERMKELGELDVTDCKHLKNNFVNSVMDIVKLRSNGIPLEIATLDTSINVKRIRKKCPSVRLTFALVTNFTKYC